MTHANSSAFAAAKARAMAARRGGRGTLPVRPRGCGCAGHSCPAGSRKCRALSRASTGLPAHASLGASLALGGRLAEVLHERKAYIRVVNFFTCSRHRPSDGSRAQCSLRAGRHRRIEQPDQPQLARRGPGIALVLDRAKPQPDQRLRGGRGDGPARHRLPGHWPGQRDGLLLPRPGTHTRTSRSR